MTWPKHALRFARPEFAAGVNVTVRHGFRWAHLQPGEVVALSSMERVPLAHAVVLEVQVMRFDQLRDSDVAQEHDPRCRDREGLRADLSLYAGYYVSDSCEVTMVRFAVSEDLSYHLRGAALALAAALHDLGRKPMNLDPQRLPSLRATGSLTEYCPHCGWHSGHARGCADRAA